jgi:hypothetical protein
MGLLTDILKEIPQAAVLKEKIADIEAKYAAADTEKAILKDDLREAKAEIAKLKMQVEELTHVDDLDEMELKLLRVIANSDYGDAVKEFLVQAFSDRPPSKAQFDYHLKRLEDLHYVRGGISDRFGNSLRSYPRRSHATSKKEPAVAATPNSPPGNTSEMAHRGNKRHTTDN